jgi:hypothetical protein
MFISPKFGPATLRDAGSAVTLRDVTDARRRVDDGRATGYQLLAPDLVQVLAVRWRRVNAGSRDDPHRPIGPLAVQDNENGRTPVLHQVGGRDRVVVEVYRGGCGWCHGVSSYR